MNFQRRVHVRLCIYLFTVFLGVCTLDAYSRATAFPSCDTLRGEAAMVRSVQSEVSFHEASRTVSSALVPVVISVPVGLFAAGHAMDNEYHAVSGVVLLSAQAITLGATFALKELIGRPRPWRAHPDCIYPGSMDDEFSFPSGHSSSAATLATYLSLRYPQWYVVAPAVLFTGYTWYARMNLGVHYPTDIIAGAILGAAVGYGAYRLTESLKSAISPVLPMPQGKPPVTAPIVVFRISL
jgi:undecaprenyl-diphosphatase